MSNYSMTLDSVDLGGATYGFMVAKGTEIAYLPKPRVDVQSLAASDGEATQGATFAGRDITVSYVVQATTHSALLAKLRAIAGVLARCQEGEQTLVFDFDTARTWRVRLMSDFTPSVGETYAEGSIQFLANPPWATAATATSGTQAIDDDTTFSISCTSERTCTVDWTFKNTGGTSWTQVALTNNTTGLVVRWAGTLADGQWLKLLSTNNSAYVSGDNGSTWALSSTGVIGTVPHLASGTNSVKVLVTGTTPAGSANWTYTGIYQ